MAEAERGLGPNWTCEACATVNSDMRIRCRRCKRVRIEPPRSRSDGRSELRRALSAERSAVEKMQDVRESRASARKIVDARRAYERATEATDEALRKLATRSA